MDMSDGNGTGLMERPAGNAVPVQARQRASVEDDGPLAFMMDSARFEHSQRIAQAMAASVFLPEHLRGRKFNGQFEEYPMPTIVGNCFRVLNQAMRWRVDPYAVADETFVTGGKLGYQGKLITAIVNTRAGLQGRLRYEFSGEGPARKVKIIGQFKNETKPVDVELTVKEGIAASDKGKGPNPMWLRDPDQKLVYSGVVKWARRHCPEVIMGVLTEDDIEAIEASREKAMLPTATNELNAKLQAAFTAPVARTALPEPIDVHPEPGELPNDSAPPEPAEPAQQGGSAQESAPEGTRENYAEQVAATRQSFQTYYETQAVAAGLASDEAGKAFAALKVAKPLTRLKERVQIVTAIIDEAWDFKAGKVK